MRPSPALTAILCSLLLAACGSSTTVVTETTTSGPTPASSGSDASSSSTGATTATNLSSASQSATSGSASSARGIAACRAADLHGSFLGQQGATGHGELGFALRNASAHACHTFGFPGVQFRNAAGAPIPTHSVRRTHDLFGPAPLVGLELASGASASFRIGVTHGLGSSAGCRTAAALSVIPPDDTVSLPIPIPGGAYECAIATVSPLRPGTSAFP